MNTISVSDFFQIINLLGKRAQNVFKVENSNFKGYRLQVSDTEIKVVGRYKTSSGNIQMVDLLHITGNETTMLYASFTRYQPVDILKFLNTDLGQYRPFYPHLSSTYLES